MMFPNNNIGVISQSYMLCVVVNAIVNLEISGQVGVSWWAGRSTSVSLENTSNRPHLQHSTRVACQSAECISF